VKVKTTVKFKSPTKRNQSKGDSKRVQKYTVNSEILKGDCALFEATTVTGVTMYMSDDKLMKMLEEMPGFIAVVTLHNADGSVKLRNPKSEKTFPAQGLLFHITKDDDDDDEEKEEEEEVEDNGDNKKSYEDKIAEKGCKIAAVIQENATPYKDTTLSVTYGYCKNDTETEKKMSDVIGINATDETVVQMFSEYFEQGTFQSDVAEAVINTYYNDAAVVPTSNRLVYVHKHLFNDS
jgi:hypothetical protein